LFSGTRVSSASRKALDAQTGEDELAGLPVELLHTHLVLLAPVGELLCTGPVAPRICLVALLKAPGHGAALVDGLAAEAGVVDGGRLLEMAAEEAAERFEEAEHVEGQRGSASASLPLPCISSFCSLFPPWSVQAR